MSIQDAILGLHEPLGQAGSGRRRYASAMTLNRPGCWAMRRWRCTGSVRRATARTLRVCSRQGGCRPGPCSPDLGPVGAILGLIDAADRLPGRIQRAGIAEIRSGLAAAGGPVTLPKRHAIRLSMNGWDRPLSSSARHIKKLASAIEAATPHLEWVTYDAYDPALIGDGFLSGHAFASLIGGDAPVYAQDFDFGLFLIRPQVLYRDHCHPAPELYAPLTVRMAGASVRARR